MSWIVFPTWLDVLNCFSNLSWCPQLTPWYKHPGWQGVEKIGSSLSACEEWPFTTVCFLRMIFSSRLSQCLDVPDLPDEDWPSSVVCFLRMILWSLTAAFLNVLMFQTYLMKTDHPLLSVSWEWSYDLWQQAFSMSWCSRPTWWRLTILCCSFPQNDRMIFNSRLFCCLDVHNLRTILWSLTAGFLNVLMFQT